MSNSNLELDGKSENRDKHAALMLSAHTCEDLIDKLTRGDYSDSGGDYRLIVFNPDEKRTERAVSIIKRGKPNRGAYDVWFSYTSMLNNGGKIAYVFPGFWDVTETETDSLSDALALPRMDQLIAEMKETHADGRYYQRRYNTKWLCKTALEKLGVKSDMYLGYSLGEWEAALFAGIIKCDISEWSDNFAGGWDSYEHFYPLVLVHGADRQLIDTWRHEIPDLYLSIDNCPSQVILTGKGPALAALIKILEEKNVMHVLIPDRTALHTPLVADVPSDKFTIFHEVEISGGHVPVWSSTTLEKVPTDRESYLEYLYAELTKTVRFREAVEKLYEEQQARIFIQIGHGPLPDFVINTLSRKDVGAISTSITTRDGAEQLRRVMALLYIEGQQVDAGFIGVTPKNRFSKGVAKPRMVAPSLSRETDPSTDAAEDRAEKVTAAIEDTAGKTSGVAGESTGATEDTAEKSTGVAGESTGVARESTGATEDTAEKSTGVAGESTEATEDTAEKPTGVARESTGATEDTAEKSTGVAGELTGATEDTAGKTSGAENTTWKTTGAENIYEKFITAQDLSLSPLSQSLPSLSSQQPGAVDPIAVAAYGNIQNVMSLEQDMLSLRQDMISIQREMAMLFEHFTAAPRPAVKHSKPDMPGLFRGNVLSPATDSQPDSQPDSQHDIPSQRNGGVLSSAVGDPLSRTGPHRDGVLSPINGNHPDTSGRQNDVNTDATTSGTPNIPNSNRKGIKFNETLKLSFKDHPYLIDHSIIRQPKDWPIWEDMNPVVPFTMILELFAEIAAKHAPGEKLIKIGNVTAFKWIELEKPLEIPVRGEWSSQETLRLNLDGYASAECTFADNFPKSETKFEGSIDIGKEILKPGASEQWYDEFSFHGPQYRSLFRHKKICERGVVGVAESKKGKGSLLDAVGQLLGLFVHITETRDTIVFPVRIQELDLFTDVHDQEGVFENTIIITKLTGGSVVMDVVIKRNGVIWRLVKSFVFQRFISTPSLWRVILDPRFEKLSAEIVPGVCCYESKLQDNMLAILTKRYLSKPEREYYNNLESPKQKREHLISRIALKDAVRSWLAEADGEMMYPIEFYCIHDEKGKPSLEGYGRAARKVENLYISLAHKGRIAAAIVSERPVGIDLENIEEKSVEFITSAFSEREQELLGAYGASDAVIRFGAAKEAYSKMRGECLEGDPKSCEISGFDGEMLIIGDVPIQTAKFGNEHIVGWTALNIARE